MLNAKNWILGFCAILCFSSAQASVWKTTRNWDDQADAEFSMWIRNLPLDIFSNANSKYAGLATDCADAAYALRIIFSYENGLPVHFQDTSSLSNDTSRFDSLSNQGQVDANGIEHMSPRLHAFIRWVGDSVGTQALTYDTYPIAINAKTMQPGVMFLHASSEGQEDVPVTYRSGHVYYLQEVGDNGMIKYIGSTVPLAVRALSARYGIVFAPQETDSGYRMWKRPDSDVRPNYSEEQFSFAGWYQHSFRDGKLWIRWQEAIQASFRTRQINIKENFQAANANLRAALQERATAVTEGWKFYQNNYSAGQCMNSSDYDDYSTPTRDTKIQYELRAYRAAAKLYLRASKKVEGEMTDTFLLKDDPTTAKPKSTNEKWIRELYLQFQMELMPGVQMNYLELWRAFMSSTALQISEPEHSPEVRWGLADQGQWPCPERRKQYKDGQNN